MNVSKREVFAPPHSVGTFSRGEFVYEPTAPWEALRSGVVAQRDGQWIVTMAKLNLDDDFDETPLTIYPGELGRHVMIDNSGIAAPRGPSLDPQPWFTIRDVVLEMLRDAQGRRLRLEPLLMELKGRSDIEDRMQTFYRGPEADGHFTREHLYLAQGVTAVCVPNKHYVYQRYELPADEHAGPYPVLFSLLPNWPGDVRTGVFLGELLSYLDLELGPKRTLTQTFMPIFDECRTYEVAKLFGDQWAPTSAAGPLGKTLKTEGAREYIRRLRAFRFGMIAASKVHEGFSSDP